MSMSMSILKQNPVSIKNKYFYTNTEISPLICVPFIGRDKRQIEEELNIFESLDIRPDVVEWRADYFNGDYDDVIELLSSGLSFHPIIFTLRSQKEGGNFLLSDAERFQIIQRIADSKKADIIDIELNNDSELLLPLIEKCKSNGVKVILSHHNFNETPPVSDILDIFSKMRDLKADIIKAAFMPLCKADVFVTMQACSIFSEGSDIPAIAISMGKLGLLSRICGGFFGSCLTYCSLTPNGESAPGQISCGDILSKMNSLKF